MLHAYRKCSKLVWGGGGGVGVRGEGISYFHKVKVNPASAPAEHRYSLNLYFANLGFMCNLAKTNIPCALTKLNVLYFLGVNLVP